VQKSAEKKVRTPIARLIDFDLYVQETYQLLRNSDLLESTILIISSDHGFRHGVLTRLPWLLSLPGRKIAGSVSGNTQRVDFAPTLLDAIGMEPVKWMEGKSILEEHQKPRHPFPMLTDLVTTVLENRSFISSIIKHLNVICSMIFPLIFRFTQLCRLASPLKGLL
jgi:membrane-anchored protein YejM (alkaline phosphatase superfamily)